MLPEAAPSGHNADLNASTSGSTVATSPVCQEEVEMRAALQFLMRHMVKRAVMRSPIKRALGLADLERAQAMIYKLVVNGLLEESSGGKVKPGKNITDLTCFELEVLMTSFITTTFGTVAGSLLCSQLCLYFFVHQE